VFKISTKVVFENLCSWSSKKLKECRCIGFYWLQWTRPSRSNWLQGIRWIRSWAMLLQITWQNISITTNDSTGTGDKEGLGSGPTVSLRTLLLDLIHDLHSDISSRCIRWSNWLIWPTQWPHPLRPVSTHYCSSCFSKYWVHICRCNIASLNAASRLCKLSEPTLFLECSVLFTCLVKLLFAKQVENMR